MHYLLTVRSSCLALYQEDHRTLDRSPRSQWHRQSLFQGIERCSRFVWPPIRSTDSLSRPSALGTGCIWAKGPTCYDLFWSAGGRSCAGFRSPGLRDYPHAPAAGDRKAPRHEVAGSWALAGSERYGDLMWARRLILVRTPARRHLHVCAQERSGECPGYFDRLSGRSPGGRRIESTSSGRERLPPEPNQRTRTRRS
jgi:hypothetical protein